MRKLILIAMVSLAASHAWAGGSRSLSLAATNASQATEQVTAAPETTQAKTAAPAATVQTATTAPASTPTAPSTQTSTVPTGAPARPIVETAKPKHRELSTEARVIRELHRHGIYW